MNLIWLRDLRNLSSWVPILKRVHSQRSSSPAAPWKFNIYGSFLKWGYPQIIQVMDNHFSIETTMVTTGDLPWLKKHHGCSKRWCPVNVLHRDWQGMVTWKRSLPREVGKQSSELRMTFTCNNTLNEGWWDLTSDNNTLNEGWCETVVWDLTSDNNTLNEGWCGTVVWALTSHNNTLNEGWCETVTYQYTQWRVVCDCGVRLDITQQYTPVMAVWLLSSGVAMCVDRCRFATRCCETYCNGCMNVAWGLCWGGSRSTKPCIFSV